MTAMGVYAVKPRFRMALRGAESILVARGVSADAITVSGLGCALAGAGALLAGCLTSARLALLTVPVLVVARLCCNALDGMVAADTRTARPVGLLLNEMCDRIADAVLLAAAAVAAGAPWLGLAAMSLVALGSAAGVTAQAAGGHRQYGGVCGKADRMLLLAAATTAALLEPRLALSIWLVLCAAGAAITTVQRAAAACRDLSVNEGALR